VIATARWFRTDVEWHAVRPEPGAPVPHAWCTTPAPGGAPWSDAPPEADLVCPTCARHAGLTHIHVPFLRERRPKRCEWTLQPTRPGPGVRVCHRIARHVCAACALRVCDDHAEVVDRQWHCAACEQRILRARRG
jgi:hypothetical protein